jgi:hydrogenase/urease accessory protein HupE
MLAALAVALTVADPALAELAGRVATPATLRDGLLAGLGQPVVVLNHLATVIAVGCLAATQRKGVLPAVIYAVATAIGAGAHIGEKTVADAGVFAALTTVALGLLIFRKKPLRRDIVFALFAGTGLINGYVMGAPIAAAAREPILAYLTGLAAIHTAIALVVMFGLQALAGRDQLQLLAMRVIGAFAVGAGAAVLLQRYAG